ncbi:MAG TPA: ABC transporter ATP-binding protein [Longimicrobiales bacterium]|nr:ABC transporter ATP-binding protein [Longimicrobiales bacterium]
MVELDRVSKQYGRRGASARALHDVSLQVPAGSVWAVVGPNGAGKSTLLSLILGFIRPTRGTVTVSGVPPREFLRDEGAAYLPEHFHIPGEWKVGGALRMFARLDGSTRTARSDADNVIERLGLGPHTHKRASELSRGLLQRVGIAQALLAGRALVVLDEPTEGLDPMWRIRLRDIVAGLRDEGRTVIMASHDLGEVERTADRALLLEHGAVRGVLETRPAAGSTARYRIVLERPFDAMGDVFPGSVPDGSGPSFTVTVAGPVELSERLGAMLGLGAVVAAVEPVHEPLEERVRAALGEDA